MNYEALSVLIAILGFALNCLLNKYVDLQAERCVMVVYNPDDGRTDLLRPSDLVATDAARTLVRAASGADGGHDLMRSSDK